MSIVKETLSVAAIRSGSVVDHIPAGCGLKLVELLQLSTHHTKVTVGLHLPSRSMGHKDLIKIEEFTISPELAGLIAIFAPGATLVIIDEYEVVHKEKVQLPTHVKKVVVCTNACCITNHEFVETAFTVREKGKRVGLVCNYCGKEVFAL